MNRRRFLSFLGLAPLAPAAAFAAPRLLTLGIDGGGAEDIAGVCVESGEGAVSFDACRYATIVADMEGQRETDVALKRLIQKSFEKIARHNPPGQELT